VARELSLPAAVAAGNPAPPLTVTELAGDER
jgi:hypothetical protein